MHRCPFWVSLIKELEALVKVGFLPFTRAIYFSQRPPMGKWTNSRSCWAPGFGRKGEGCWGDRFSARVWELPGVLSELFVRDWSF